MKVWNVLQIENVNVGQLSHWMPFCGLTPPQVSCDLLFLYLKHGMSQSVVHALPENSEIAVRPICSSLISHASVGFLLKSYQTHQSHCCNVSGRSYLETSLGFNLLCSLLFKL